MQPSARSPFTLAVLLATLLVTACGVSRRDAVKPEPVRPAPASTPSGAKPAPAPLVNKGDPQKRFDAALASMRAGQLDQAETQFQALTVDFPQFAGPWTDLGIIYAKSNRRDAAIAALSRAVSMNRRNAIAHNWLGILYRDAGDFGRAERAYRAALAEQPNYGLAHLNLGILYDEYLKRPQDALQHYRAYRQYGGQDDLRVLAWLADIEGVNKPAAATAPAAGSAPAAGATRR
jgi:tetratricopeptide (TPR) repeat protein